MPMCTCSPSSSVLQSVSLETQSLGQFNFIRLYHSTFVTQEGLGAFPPKLEGLFLLVVVRRTSSRASMQAAKRRKVEEKSSGSEQANTVSTSPYDLLIVAKKVYLPGADGPQGKKVLVRKGKIAHIL